tara:strand:- start:383 stop:1423 length:1041 start_codon:yes stop_codon:yes gene_type:complete
MKKSIFLLTSFVLILLFIQCDNDISNSSLPSKEKLIENYYNNGIIKDIESVLNRIDENLIILNTFRNEPTQTHLDDAINDDKQLHLEWEGLEVYRLQVFRLLYSSVQTFPVNESVKSEILTLETINKTTVEALFDDKSGLFINSFLLNTLSLDEFKSEPKYIAFLQANTLHVKDKILILQQAWKDIGPSFLEATGFGFDQSQDQIFNIYVGLIETIKLIKLDDAITNNDMNRLESPYNDLSIQLIQKNLISIQNSFNGNFGTENTYGFDDYLIDIGQQDLNNRVNDKITAAYNISKRIVSLNQVIENKDLKGRELSDSIQELLLIFKIELSSVLGTSISFTDNDGD